MNTQKNYPFKYQFPQSEISAVRAVCMYLTQKYKKMIENYDRDLYIDWSENGLIIRAKDQDTLSKAVDNIKNDRKLIQIDILADHIHKDDYQRFIETELQELHQQEKAFIHIVSYDKFEIKSQNLQEKGFALPLQKYNELKVKNPYFSLLMCTDRRFNEIRQILVEKLRPFMRQKQETLSLRTPSTWDEEENNDNDEEENHNSLNNTNGHQNKDSQDIDSPKQGPYHHKDSTPSLIRGNIDLSHINEATTNDNVNIHNPPAKRSYNSTSSGESEKSNSNGVCATTSSSKSHQYFKQAKYDIKIKKLLWLFSIDYLDLKLDKINIFQSHSHQHMVELSLNEDAIQKDNLFNQYEKLDDTLANFNGQIKMKIIFQDQSPEFYQNLSCSRAFNKIASKFGNVALFYYRILDITIKDIGENKTFSKILQNYYEQKLQSKPNFCYLIAPNHLFNQIKQQILDLQRSLNLTKVPSQDTQQSELQYVLRNYRAENYLLHIDLKEISIEQQHYKTVGRLSGVQFCIKKYENVPQSNAKRILRKIEISQFYTGPRVAQVYGYIIDCNQQFGDDDSTGEESKDIKFIKNTNNNIYIISELQSKNLREAINDDSFFTIRLQLEIALEIAMSVLALHNHPLRPTPHGNIKPENVLISMDEAPPFQIFLDDILSTQKITELNRYIPAQKVIGQIPSPSDDVWALGLIFYQLFFKEDIDTQSLIKNFSNYQQQIKENPIDNKALCQLIAQMLVVDQSSRIQCQDVVTRLKQIVPSG